MGDDSEGTNGAIAAGTGDDRWERHPADVARLVGAVVRPGAASPT